jgi:zinc finger protein
MLKNDYDAILKIQTACPSCGASIDMKTCVVDIPHFKEAIIMNVTCEECGYTSNEVKGSGEIESHGTRISLRVESINDMSRHVVKSDTACVAIPEIDFQVQESGLGVYTTVEGLLVSVHDRLKEANPFASSSSSDGDDDGSSSPSFSSKQDKFEMFLSNLKSMAEGKRLPFTLIITDPVSSSFVGPIPEEYGGDIVSVQITNQIETTTDTRITIEKFERSQEQNENLGLSDKIT